MLQPALLCVAGFNLEIFKRLPLRSGAAEWPETKIIHLVRHSLFELTIWGTKCNWAEYLLNAKQCLEIKTVSKGTIVKL